MKNVDLQQPSVQVNLADAFYFSVWNRFSEQAGVTV
jgi:hypothetical protein